MISQNWNLCWEEFWIKWPVLVRILLVAPPDMAVENALILARVGLYGHGKKYKTITESAVAVGVAKRRIRMEIKPDPADTVKRLMQKCDHTYL